MFFRLGEFALYTTQTRTLPLCRKPIISVSVHTFLLNEVVLCLMDSRLCLSGSLRVNRTQFEIGPD